MQGRAVRALAARRPAAGDSQELYAGGKRNSLSSLQSTTKDSEVLHTSATIEIKMITDRLKNHSAGQNDYRLA
eukprot:1115775-Amphidinium_carterae.1